MASFVQVGLINADGVDPQSAVSNAGPQASKCIEEVVRDRKLIATIEEDARLMLQRTLSPSVRQSLVAMTSTKRYDAQRPSKSVVETPGVRRE